MSTGTQDSLSRIGGAAQGGSAKPRGEREAKERDNEHKRDDKPAGEGGATQGQVGGLSNDSRTDEDRDRGDAELGRS
jgi:hypothetical protein